MTRIALLTPEFVTEYADGGGLGNYLHRFARSLTAAGHNVEIFVSSQSPSGVIDMDGIRGTAGPSALPDSEPKGQSSLRQASARNSGVPHRAHALAGPLDGKGL